MKKILLLTGLLILFSPIIFAKHVDENTAKQAGQNFITRSTNSQALNLSKELELVYACKPSGSSAGNSAGQTIFFYVFNAGTAGFVVVAGDDNVSPILAYSDEGTFNPNTIPQNTRKWFEDYKNQIRYVIDNKIDATNEIKETWEQLLSEKQTNSIAKASVPPLVQTKWNQSPYYNALCPSGTVTGCVATAMAQVMKYWNYPATGSGFRSYNHQTYGTLSANFGSTTYQWSAMPNVVNSPNNAVATLMYQCGVSVDMNYGPASSGGSSATYAATENALKTYFGYKSTLSLIMRSDYNQNQWMDALKAELNASRPILYAGVGSGGGHAFVCDGYDNNNLFHFNWGWGGNSDGYFQVNALNPGSLGTGGGSGGFNSSQHAIIGIEPTSGGVSQNYNLQLYSTINMASQFWFTNPFSLTVDIANLGTGTFSGQYGAAIFDNNNNFVDFMEVKSNMTLNSNSHYTTPLTFSNAGSPAYVPGFYKVALFYKTATQDWTIIGNGNYTNLKQFEIYYSSAIETNSAFTITTNGGKLIKGSNANVNLDVINTGSNTFFGNYRVSLANLDGTWAQNIGIVTEGNGLPTNYHYPSGNNFTGEITVEPGTYLMEVAYNAQGTSNWYYAGSSNFSNPIYVIVEAPVLSPDQYEVNNTLAQAYTLPISFSGNTTTKNTIGSNLHIGADLDFYKVNLPSGYDYVITARLHDSFNSVNGNSYSVDGLVSYSVDGANWSDAYDDIINDEIIVENGGTIYFQVAPYFSGETGTYLLDIEIIRTDVIVGVNESNMLSDLIKVYPNPAKDFVIVDCNSFPDKINSISVLNVQGKQISSAHVITNEQTTRLSLEELSNGIYFIQMQTSKGILTKKIIISQ